MNPAIAFAALLAGAVAREGARAAAAASGTESVEQALVARTLAGYLRVLTRAATLEAAGAIETVRRATVFGDRLHLTVDSAEEAAPAVERRLREAGAEPTGLRPVAPSLEDVFIERVAEAWPTVSDARSALPPLTLTLSPKGGEGTPTRPARARGAEHLEPHDRPGTPPPRTLTDPTRDPRSTGAASGT